MSTQHAQLDLALIADAERTRPARALATPPLRISRVRYDNAANPAEVQLTLTQLGGMLAGDTYRVRVDLGSAAQAWLTPAAATQIYTMPHGQAEQHVQIRTAPNAHLYWQTAPQILFADAHYRQHTCITLAPRSCVVLSEIVVAGRLAHGECWQFRHYTSCIEICSLEGRLLAGERMVIEPQRRRPDRNGVMGAYPVLGTLWMLGDPFDAERIARHVSSTDQSISAAVLPGACGLVVRVLGRHLAATQDRLAQLAQCSKNA
jgi:urease accessory protein